MSHNGVIIDFDSVLFPFHQQAVLALNEQFGTLYETADVTHWEWLTELPKEQRTYLWQELYPSYDWTMRQGPIPGTERVFTNLRRINAAPVVVTDRKPYLEDNIRQWINHYFNVYPEVFTKEEGRTKLDIANQLNIDTIIEDAPHHALSFAEAGKTVYLVDTPYNQAVAHPQITRVSDVIDAVRHITRERVNFPFIEQRWIPALRSGKYPQGKGALRKAGAYCCLGVACDILSLMGIVSPWEDDAINGESLVLPHEAARFIGIGLEGEGFYEDDQEVVPVNLTTLNDSRDYTFDQIADRLQAFVDEHRIVEAA